VLTPNSHEFGYISLARKINAPADIGFERDHLIQLDTPPTPLD
jgi:hypothetical protein